jgi:hypothetical protein
MVRAADDAHKKRLNRIEIVDLIKHFPKQMDVLTLGGFFRRYERLVVDENRFHIASSANSRTFARCIACPLPEFTGCVCWY